MFVLKNENYVLSIIMIISFMLKILAINIFNLPNFVDSQAYIKAGYEILNYFEIKKNIIMPLYSIVAFYNEKFFNFYFFNIIFSTANIYLIFLITKKIFLNTNVAVISAILMAIYPFNIFYAVTGFSETFFLFLLFLGFYFLYNKKILPSAIFFSLSILCRPLGELIYPIIFLYFLVLIYNYKIKIIFLNLLKYLVVYILIMSPWWYHNYLKYGEFLRLNLGFGLTFYAGNNPLNKTGGGVIIDEDDLRKFPERFSKVLKDYEFEEFKGKSGFELKVDYIDENGDVETFELGYGENKIDPDLGYSLGEVRRKKGIAAALIRERHFKDAAQSYIKNNPLKFIENMFIKFKRFCSLAPQTQEFSGNFYKFVSVSTMLLLYFFSISGLILNKNFKNLKLGPLFIFLLYVNLVHMITISSIRYRFIVEWILIILASYSLNYFYVRLKK